MGELQVGELIYSADRDSGASVKVFKGRLGSRDVAIKKLQCDEASSLNGALNEALIQAKLSGYSAVCEIISMNVEYRNRGYESTIVMEWMETDLKTEIERRRMANESWSEDQLMDFLYCLIEALESMQKRGICHRDLKPENVFLSLGKIKVSDFGTSKQNMFSNSTGTLVGTPGYLSPELFECYQEFMRTGTTRALYNPFKSDVYSLGVTFLHMSLLNLPSTKSGITPDAAQQLFSLLSPKYETLKKLIVKMMDYTSTTRPDFISLFSELKALKLMRERQQKPCLHCKQRTLTQMSSTTVVLECSHLHYFHSRECLEDFLKRETKCYSRSVYVLCPECGLFISHEFLSAIFGGEAAYGNFISECKKLCMACYEDEGKKLACGHVFCDKCLTNSYLVDRLICPLCGTQSPYTCDTCKQVKDTELKCGHIVCGHCSRKKRDKFHCDIDDAYSPRN